MRCAARFTGFEGKITHAKAESLCLRCPNAGRTSVSLGLRFALNLTLVQGLNPNSHQNSRQLREPEKQPPKQPSGLFSLVRKIVFGDTFGLKSDKTASGCFGGCSFSTFLLFTAAHCKEKRPYILMKVNNLVRLFASGCKTLQNP